MATPEMRDIPKDARVSTRRLRLSHLACLSLHVKNVELLEMMKPTHMDNDFETWELDKDGKLILHNSRFKTKVRHSRQVCLSARLEVPYATLTPVVFRLRPL